MKLEPKDTIEEDHSDKAVLVEREERGREDEDCESGHGPSLPMSPQSGIIHPEHGNFFL